MPTRRELAAAEQAAIAARFEQRARNARVSQGDYAAHDGAYDEFYEEAEAPTMARDPRDFRAPSDLPTEALDADADADAPQMPPRSLPNAASAPVQQPRIEPFVDRDRPGYYEIEVDGDSVQVGLRSRDGRVNVIDIPPMTMKRINMLGWHQERVNRLQQQLLVTTKEENAKQVAESARKAQERLVMYLIPEFPVGLFGEMSAVGFKRLMDIIQQMTQEALELDDEGGTDPNA